LGNFLSSEETIEGLTTTKEYTYDKEERLLTSIHTSEEEVKEYTCQYDRAGNKISVEESIDGKVTQTQYTFDESNALLSEEGEMGMDYQYDDNGSATRFPISE
jgi:YD repeat-containing protein